MTENTMNTASDLFDIIAKIFLKINLQTKTTKENIYRRYWSSIMDVNKVVEEKFQFFDKREKSIVYDSLTPSDLLILSLYIEESDPYDCFLILVYLDTHMDFKKSMKRFLDKSATIQKGIFIFKSLNKNGAGILLPRFASKWAKKNNITRATCNAKPFSLIKKFLWCMDCGNFEVDHIYVDMNPLAKADIVDTDEEEHFPFRIVCSPLVDEQPFKYALGNVDGTNKFFVRNYPRETQNIVIKRISETIQYAREVNASIVFFPEMMVSPDKRAQIVETIKDGWEYTFPKIIFLPSSEYKKEDNWKNEVVAVNDIGDVIYTYNKQRAYQHNIVNAEGAVQEVYFEPIYPDNKFTVLHVNQIGRIGVLICADIFDDEIKANFIGKYDLDMVLIVSYTGGWDLFDRCLTGMNDTLSEVIVCNSCAAIKKGQNDNVYPVAYYPFGHRQRDGNFKKKCSNNCTGCAFCIEIKDNYNENDSDPIIQKKFIEGG